MAARDDTFNRDEFTREYSRCYAEEVELVRPRGVRKYYAVRKPGYQCHLGTTWVNAKIRIDAGMKWLREMTIQKSHGK